MKQLGFNIRLHLILALGSKESLWEYIDSVYDQNKWEFYRAYINGGFKDDISKSTFSAQTEERVIKIMAINTWCENQKDYTLIYDIIKKGYKKVWNYFKKSKDQVVYIDLYIKNRFEKLGIDNVSELEIYNELFVLLFLCHNNEVDYAMSASQDMIREYNEKFHIDTFARAMREHNILENGKYINLEESINAIYEDMSINTKFFKEDKSINLVLDKVISEDEKKLYAKLNGKSLKSAIESRLTTNEYFSFRDKVFSYSYSKYIGIYSQMVKMMGFNEEIFERVRIDKKEMDFIITHYEVSKEVNNLDENQKENTIISLMFIYALSSLYKDLKRKHLEDSKDEEFKELEKLREVLEKKNSIIEEKMNVETTKYAETKKRIELIEAENAELKRANKKLSMELDEYENNTKELVAMREFMYNQQNADYNEAPENQTSKEEFINSKKIAIFGGHPIWHSKIKERFPNIILIAPERVNLDFSFVDKLDCVFVHSSYCNHSMYKKLMNSIRNNDCMLGYTNGVNMDITINDIYNKLKSNK